MVMWQFPLEIFDLLSDLDLWRRKPKRQSSVASDVSYKWHHLDFSISILPGIVAQKICFLTCHWPLHLTFYHQNLTRSSRLCLDTNKWKNFHHSWFSSFCVVLVTAKPINQHKDMGENISCSNFTGGGKRMKIIFTFTSVKITNEWPL